MFLDPYSLALVILAALWIRALRSSSPSLESVVRPAEFRRFQIHYLLVYLCAMLADWIKGPYIYRLYESYGFSAADIAKLYVSGFVSSLTIGTYVASLSDRIGRRRCCCLYSITYILSALTKVFNNFWILMAGRLLSGISTSLLYTVFEAWYTSAHRSYGYHDSLLQETFAVASMGNGVVAVLSGVVSQALVQASGYTTPFLFAILPLCLGGIASFLLPCENYGDELELPGSEPPSPKVSTAERIARRDGEDFGAPEQIRAAPQRSIPLLGSVLPSSMVDALHSCILDPSLALLGLSQGLFEGSMYTWVYLWTPALVPEVDSDEQHHGIPYGIIFSCFMAAIVLGGSLFRIFAKSGPNLSTKASQERLPLYLHPVAASALLSSTLLFNHKYAVFLCFCVYEVCCGLFFPTYASIRSMRVPSSCRAAMMSLYRVPLNVIVIAFLSFAATDRVGTRPMLVLVALVNLAVCILFAVFQRSVARSVRNIPLM